MSNRGLTYTETATLVSEECYSCGVLFGIPNSMQRRLRDTHAPFYCPNGHAQSYTGQSEAEKARRRAAELERRLASRDDDLRAERMAHSATKGQLTRTRKRADAGVCQHCHRSFVKLARHVAHMHPAATP
jgi:hypothetical protein